MTYIPSKKTFQITFIYVNFANFAEIIVGGTLNSKIIVCGPHNLHVKVHQGRKKQSIISSSNST